MTQHGIDQLQGLGMNRDAVASEETLLVYSSTSLHPYVDDADTLTLYVDNHFAVSAQITIILTYALGA